MNPGERMLLPKDKPVRIPFCRNKKEKVKDVSSLLKRAGILLEEGYTFSEALLMLIPYHVEELETWKERIGQQFHSGSSVADILRHFSVPKHFLILIQIGEENGELAETLIYVSEQMKFYGEIRRKLLKLLVYPAFLIAMMTILFILFRHYFLPNMQQIALSTNSEGLMGLKWAFILLHFPDFLIGFFIITIFIFACSFHYLRRRKVSEQLHFIMKMPIVNHVYKIVLTRQFSHLLGSLLASGISLQQALSILEQQQLSRHLSHITAMLKQRVIFGDSLSDAVKILQCFTPKFDEFIRHGEQSGYLGREMLIYSDLLNERIQAMLKTFIASIQPFFFIVIALCIVAAYLSILLPMYDLVEMM